VHLFFLQLEIAPIEIPTLRRYSVQPRATRHSGDGRRTAAQRSNCAAALSRSGWKACPRNTHDIGLYYAPRDATRSWRGWSTQ